MPYIYYRMLGEYSLTDRRFSRIDKFMADTLFDENHGGKHGNCHVAIGSSYSDTYAGDVSKLTPAKKRPSAITNPRCTGTLSTPRTRR